MTVHTSFSGVSSGQVGKSLRSGSKVPRGGAVCIVLLWPLWLVTGGRWRGSGPGFEVSCLPVQMLLLAHWVTKIIDSFGVFLQNVIVTPFS